MQAPKYYFDVPIMVLPNRFLLHKYVLAWRKLENAFKKERIFFSLQNLRR